MPDHRRRRGLTAARFKPTPDRGIACAVPGIRDGAAELRCSRRRFVASSRRVPRSNSNSNSGIANNRPSRCGPSMARRRRPRGPNTLRVLQSQHNVGLCKPPRCHGACEGCASRADARTRRASASLRIINVDVGRSAGRCAAGSTGPCSGVVLRRAHPCARSSVQPPALRVDRLPSLRLHRRHALRVLRTRKAACALRAHAWLRPRRSVARGRTWPAFGNIIGRALVWKSRRFAGGCRSDELSMRCPCPGPEPGMA